MNYSKRELMRTGLMRKLNIIGKVRLHFDVAVYGSNLNCMKILIQAGADVNAQNRPPHVPGKPQYYLQLRWEILMFIGFDKSRS